MYIKCFRDGILHKMFKTSDSNYIKRYNIKPTYALSIIFKTATKVRKNNNSQLIMKKI